MERGQTDAWALCPALWSGPFSVAGDKTGEWNAFWASAHTTAGSLSRARFPGSFRPMQPRSSEAFWVVSGELAVAWLCAAL
ncbi:hypothetical protein AAFF_G00059600 [Aldrovandia affinis]|uniref:Uncharacterized protein n=1 Tax=Aldrovandia affinis TaxID=143900 RepID=A0AAD7S0E0_9TELE|nr:hypothetical protein AAFF_G00059600 [Aldrovandia affinis]